MLTIILKNKMFLNEWEEFILMQDFIYYAKKGKKNLPFNSDL